MGPKMFGVKALLVNRVGHSDDGDDIFNLHITSR